MLGLPYPPAFADPNTNGPRILGGVNYASAAAGILDESGQHYVYFTYPKFHLIVGGQHIVRVSHN